MVVASAGHVGGIRGPCIVSSVLGMSVVRVRMAALPIAGSGRF